MNKLQYIELLNMRGVTELKGRTIAGALRETGGDPTDFEMMIVNRNILNNERRKKLNKINENR
jgi:hypothetical protein